LRHEEISKQTTNFKTEEKFNQIVIPFVIEWFFFFWQKKKKKKPLL